ncbi:MAG: LptF/LptG family permease [Myxococcaceae bacterium]
MRGTLFRYVLSLYLKYFLAIFVAVLAIFLIADFGDRVKAYASHPFLDILELYWNKLLVTAQVLGPAGLLLAASAGISTLRKRGELTALKALAFPPAALYLPVGACALVAALGLAAFDEYVVTKASAQVDEISHSRFQTWGDWSRWFRQQQWFRRGNRIFYLRGGDALHRFDDVTVLTLSPEFRLVSRLDARHMEHLEGTRWRLGGVEERRFEGPGPAVTTVAEGEYDLGAPANAFRIRSGRPEQMRFAQLLEQIEARRQAGLSTQQWILALHNRFAYPLTGFAAALLAVGIALRPGRKGHLTVALVEGLTIAVVLWGLMVVGKALAIAGHLPAGLAAWAPFTVLVVAAAVLWLRREGMLGWSGI